MLAKRTFSFTLKLDISRDRVGTDDNKVFKEFPDGTFGCCGQSVYIDVAREAMTLEKAIKSALAGAKRLNYPVNEIIILPEDLVSK